MLVAHQERRHERSYFGADGRAVACSHNISFWFSACASTQGILGAYLVARTVRQHALWGGRHHFSYGFEQWRRALAPCLDRDSTHIGGAGQRRRHHQHHVSSDESDPVSTAGSALLIGRFGQRFENAEEIVAFPLGAFIEEFDHCVFQHKNVVGSHFPCCVNSLWRCSNSRADVL